jgi:hypothetical protein
MKTIWFVLFNLMLVSQVLGQVQDFEDHMSLYRLNQSDVEDRLGYSCNVYVSWMCTYEDKREDATDRYVHVTHKGNVHRADVWFGGIRSDDPNTRNVKSSTLRTPEFSIRTNFENKMEKTVKRNTPAWEFHFSPFEYGQYPPMTYGGWGFAHADFPNIECYKSEDESRGVVWSTLSTHLHMFYRIEFDKEVGYLPRKITGMTHKTPDTKISRVGFTGESPDFVQVSEWKLNWKRIESHDLFVPTELYGTGSLLGRDDKIQIVYKNWKLGDDVDKTALDEDAFIKINPKQFNFEALIKAFPEHKSAIITRQSPRLLFGTELRAE